MKINKRTWINKNGKKGQNFQVRVKKLDGKWERLSFKTKLEAQKFIKDTLEMSMKGEELIAKNANRDFDYYFDKYLEYLKIHKSRSTYLQRQNLYNSCIKPFIGNVKIKNINKQVIMDFVKIDISSSGRKLSSETRKQTFQIVMSVLDHARADSACIENIARRLKNESGFKLLPPVKNHRNEKALSFWEGVHISRIIQRKSFNVSVMWELLLLTVVRVGEACALEKRDFDFERRVFKNNKKVSKAGGWHEGPTKTYRSDEIVIPDYLYEKLLIITKDLKDDEKIFKNLRNKPIRPDSFNKTFLYPALRELGLEVGRYGYSAHDARHSGISMGFELGINPVEISHLAGHSNFSTTAKVYAHKINKRGYGAVNELSKEFEKYANQISDSTSKIKNVEPKPTILDQNNKFGTKMTQNAKKETQMSKIVREKQSKKGNDTYLFCSDDDYQI